MNDLIRQRMDQARLALEEAQALLDDAMDIGFVLTSVYYAFYYPVLALLCEGQVPETMQSVTLRLFEQQYIGTGKLPRQYYDSMRRVFDIKPKCSGERTPVSREEVDTFIAMARDFIGSVERLLGA